MKSRFAWVMTSLCCGAALLSGADDASAQAALDDDVEEEATPPPETTESSPIEDPANKTMIGAGVRIRSVHVPQGLVEIFVERAAGGSSEIGFGLEVARRKGNFEVQFGLEYDKIHIVDGIWIDKGDELPQDEPDFVQFDGFGWVTAEVTFLNHTEISKQFAIRYGGGAGIGIIRGEIRRTDYRCQSADLETCAESPAAENINEPYDIPPVMLVVNAIVGVQIRPIDKVFINIEGGLRTLPFFGATAGYYF